MSIRFCEFCSTVHPDETTHCPDCGTRLVQTASEESFNDPDNPWPFEPVSSLYLQIQGKPRHLCFSGTHSVFHLWSVLHSEYSRRNLYCRVKADEMELVSYPEDQYPGGYELLGPAQILGNKHCKFSLYTYQESDPEVDFESDGLEMIYHGSLEIMDCPQRYWKDILGWLVATAPYTALENNWTYVLS